MRGGDAIHQESGLKNLVLHRFHSADGAAAITGQVIYVDSGYQIMGM